MDVSRGGLDIQALSVVWCAQRCTGPGDLQSIADISTARCMASNHPDVYELVDADPAPTSGPAQSAVAIRYVGGQPRHEDHLYGTGLVWHGPGDLQRLADRDTAQRAAQNHPHVYDLVEIEPN